MEELGRAAVVEESPVGVAYDRRSLGTRIADRLAMLIVVGRLGPGQRLVQSEIAVEFQVSRLPVRDAFAILTRRDLVYVENNRVYVQPVTLQTMRELYELRLLIEPAAMRSACQNLTDAELDALEAMVDDHARRLAEGGQAEYPLMNQEFHETLNGHCQNKSLRELLSRLLWRAHQGISLGRHDEAEWAKDSLDSHRNLLAAMRSRDLEAVRQQTLLGIVPPHKFALPRLEA